MQKVWVYEKGSPNERRFKSEEEAQVWFAKNDPEGVAFAEELKADPRSRRAKPLGGG